MRRHKRQIAQVDRIPDVRRRSTIELAERCNYVAGHAQHVARLALAMFDQTRAIHGLTDREREWLEYAALMHDLGAHISYARHHRHSYYLIKNGDLRGFEPDEIDVIALVARYHRRGTPKRAHEEYAGLSPSCGEPSGRLPRFSASPRASTAATRRSSRTWRCRIRAAKRSCCSSARPATRSWRSGRQAATWRRSKSSFRSGSSSLRRR